MPRPSMNARTRAVITVIRGGISIVKYGSSCEAFSLIGILSSPPIRDGKVNVPVK